MRHTLSGKKETHATRLAFIALGGSLIMYNKQWARCECCIFCSHELRPGHPFGTSVAGVFVFSGGQESTLKGSMFVHSSVWRDTFMVGGEGGEFFMSQCFRESRVERADSDDALQQPKPINSITTRFENLQSRQCMHSLFKRSNRYRIYCLSRP